MYLMGCRKNSPGRPCCCCGTITLPTDWESLGECCAECNKTITDEWTNICTDAIREDVRSASVDMKMWTRELSVITDPIQCVEDPPGSGIVVCTVGGITLEDCPSDSLCGTTTYSQATTQTLKLVARWKRLKQVDTLSRVLTKCDAEETATCKWVVVSKVCITIEWGYKWFIDDDVSITNTSACCKATAVSSTTAAPSCASAAAEMYLQNTTNVCLTRSKYFTSAPSGTITLNPGDAIICDAEIYCDPNTFPITAVDTDEIELLSATSSDAIAWTEPDCVTTTNDVYCRYVYKPNAGNCTNAEIVEDMSHTETRSTVVINGSLLGPLSGVYGMTFQSACQGADLCTDWIEVTRMACENLTSSHTDSGHTNRSILITLPAWTVDLESCEDA